MGAGDHGSAGQHRLERYETERLGPRRGGRDDSDPLEQRRHIALEPDYVNAVRDPELR